MFHDFAYSLGMYRAYNFTQGIIIYSKHMKARDYVRY